MMENKNGDGRRSREGEEQAAEEEGRREQLTLEQNKHYPRRPLSNCISIDYQVSLIIYSFCLEIIFSSLNEDQSRFST